MLFYQCFYTLFKCIEDSLLVPAEKLQRLDFLFCEVTKVCRFAAQAWFSADDLCLEMERHDMRLVPIRINDELVGMAVHADQPLYANPQARFLPHFAFACLCHRLARIHAAARQAPLTVIGAARKKDPPVLIEDRSGAAKS